MKYCPVCQQQYADDTLNFCLEDGSNLLTDEFISNSPTLAFNSSLPELLSRRSFHNYPSIAILPFLNVSSDTDNEFFCDGLTEELINSLMKLEKLRVAARTSTFSFKGSELDVRRIGQALEVQNVLEGSVRKSGDRLRISVQLISVADGYQVWSERYDLQLEDIFEIQEEIALAIVEALKVKLLSNEKAFLRKRYTDNVEAYELYLKGRLWNRRTADGFKTAIGYFKQAIEVDAEYAVAYSGIADHYTLLSFYEALPPAMAAEQAKTFAKKGIDLDNTLAETHASYGVTLGGFDWNWAEARKEYKRSIEINPNYLAAHGYYALNLAVQGRIEDALHMSKRCVEIDSLLPIANANLAYFYYLAREYDKAEEQARLTIQIEPNHFSAHWVLGATLGAAGRFAESFAALENAITVSAKRPFVVAELGRILGLAKKKREAKGILKKLKDASKEHYISPLNYAKIHLGLGEIDSVFEWLEKGLEERSTRMPFLLVDPQFDGIRTDKRFVKLTKKMGMETAAKK